MDFLPLYARPMFDFRSEQTSSNYVVDFEKKLRTGMKRLVTSEEILTANTENKNIVFPKLVQMLEGSTTHEKAPATIDYIDADLEFCPDITVHNRISNPTNWLKVKSIIAIIAGFAPMAIGVEVIKSGAVTGNNPLMSLGLQMTIGGAALLIGGASYLHKMIAEEELVGFNETD
ncbi:MAG: hypothetical protein H0U49_09345 [Parachlamydiaceae bacterium]|nr:hypothetical protein [Parachlamydiaceae bacterium]